MKVWVARFGSSHTRHACRSEFQLASNGRDPWFGGSVRTYCGRHAEGAPELEADVPLDLRSVSCRNCRRVIRSRRAIGRAA